MDENFNNHENHQEGSGENRQQPENMSADNNQNMDDKIRHIHPNGQQHENGDINRLTMDEGGNIQKGGDVAAVATSSRTYVVLGWVSAAFTAFVSPYFAILGIIFGMLANRQEKGRGNAVIIANIVVAAVNILFGLFLITTMRRMMFGF